MKEEIYIVTCPDCEQELYEGSLKEVKAMAENDYYDWSDAEYEGDDIYHLLCTDCARLLS